MKGDALYSGRDDVGANDAALSARISDLESRVGEDPAAGAGITAPEPFGTFAIAYERTKKRLLVTFAATIPSNTKRLKTVIIRTDKRTNATVFEQNLLRETIDVEEQFAQANHIEYKFGIPVEYAVQYDLVRLVAFDGTGNGASNPSTDPVFGDSPLSGIRFTTPDKFGVPSSPSVSLILKNELDPTTKEYDAQALVRVLAPTDSVTGANQSYAASNTETVVVVLQRDGGEKLKYSHTLTADELAQVDGSGRGFVDIMCKPLAPGGNYSWVRNVCHGTGDIKESTGPAVPFIAGGFQTNPANLTGLSLSVNATGEPFDGRMVRVTLNATQPATPVALRNVRLQIRRTNQTDADYVDAGDDALRSLREDANHVALSPIASCTWDIRTKPSKQYRVRARIKAMGGLTQDVTSADFIPQDVVLPAKNYQFSDVNMVFNGGFLLSRFDTVAGSTTDLANDWRTFVGGANPRITTTPTAVGLSWDKTNHRLQFDPIPIALRTPSIKIKKQLLPGEVYALSYLIKAASAFDMGSMIVTLYDVSSTGVVTQITTPLQINSTGDINGTAVLSFPLTTQYAMWGALLQVPSTYVASDGTQWLELELGGGTAATFTIYIDNVMLVRGSTIMPWSPHPSEVDFDHSITGVPDTGSGAIASQGGGHNPIYGDSSIGGTEITIASGRRFGQIISAGTI